MNRRDLLAALEPIITYLNAEAFRLLVVRGLQAALATLALYGLLRGLAALCGRLRARLEDPRAKLPSLRIQHIEILPAARVREGLLKALGLARAAATLLLSYVYLALVLSLFPRSSGLASDLLGYVLAPLSSFALGVLGFIPNLIFIAVTLAIVRYLLKLLNLIFDEVGAQRLRLPGFHPDWAEPTWQITRFLAVAFTIVIIFPYLPGSDSSAFKGVSVFLGVLLSLGSGSAISNSVSGVIMTYMRPFAKGDRVRIADTTGDVLERSLLVTRLRTIKNEEVTIPNALVLGAHIVNYSAALGHGGLILHAEVTIGYDAPWRKVHRLLLEAAASVEGVEKSPAPFVLQTALGDYSVRYELNAHTRRPNEMATLYSRLHEAVQDRFNAEGVEIMSPAFEVRRAGPASTIPSDPLGA